MKYRITENNVDDVIGSLKAYVDSLDAAEARRKEIVNVISGIAQSLKADSQRVIPGGMGEKPEEPLTSGSPDMGDFPEMEFDDDGNLIEKPAELEMVHDPDNPDMSEFDVAVEEAGAGAMSALAAQGEGVDHPEDPDNVTAILYSKPGETDEEKKKRIVKRPSME